jgi:hypothetical protein
MYYRVKKIQIYKGNVQLAYSNNLTGQYISLTEAMNDVRDYLCSPDFFMMIDELHYYIEVCDHNHDQDPLFKFLYCGDHKSISTKTNKYLPFNSEQEVIEHVFPTKDQFEVET